MKTLIVLSFSLLFAACSAPAPEPKIDKSPASQQQRAEAIQQLIDGGYFREVEEQQGLLPRVYVTQRFMALDFKEKEVAISVVYAHNFDGSDNAQSVGVYDVNTGNQIGTYALVYGGLKMQ